MPAELHETSLIALLAIGFVLALLLGLLANMVRISPIVGYLLAGIAVGPFTPGFVGDAGLASQLAEIGVILLMFGVGLHFSIKDLLAVRHIALPGAVAQIITATAIGYGLAYFLGWSTGAGLVFGLSLSVASTVVLLRALEERNALQSSEGKMAVGWLIVEDLAMVLALVLLPALAPSMGGDPSAIHAPGTPSSTWLAILVTLGKVVLFVVLALVVGTRVVPWLLMRVTRTGTRELFTLCVLAIALGIAYGSSAAFDVSFALGAFFAGVILSESELSHQAGNDSLPLKDAFAVLFFVSVGMLFDPTVLLREPLEVLAVLAIIMFGKSIAAFVIVLAFRHPVRTALTVSASLAQIGEFSFILAGLGAALGLLPPEGRDLILAGALLSIALNPLTFAGIDPLNRWLEARPRLLRLLERRGAEKHRTAAASTVGLRDHAILVGYGRVGGAIGEVLRAQQLPFAVIERDHLMLASAQAAGVPTIVGDAATPGVLEAAGIAQARLAVVATPDSFQARRIVELARQLKPGIDLVVRTHSASEMQKLEALGAGRVVFSERELAFGMLEYALRSLGVPAERARAAAGRAAPVNPEGT
ncbi:MAG TPA: YbaL family putative K(+) efflux transporter [Steroidobacteraceae bacterium]|jgi:CPA2 family monovalent cation:H+ antiporter-2|nr:YbaL family putative K(+) efflux transporter [Steroidobacteraceae bacterium]